MFYCFYLIIHGVISMFRDPLTSLKAIPWCKGNYQNYQDENYLILLLINKIRETMLSSTKKTFFDSYQACYLVYC